MTAGLSFSERLHPFDIPKPGYTEKGNNCTTYLFSTFATELSLELAAFQDDPIVVKTQARGGHPEKAR